MTKEEAKKQWRINLEDLKRKGLVSPENLYETIDMVVDAVFDWAEQENVRKPTFDECCKRIKQIALNEMGGYKVEIRLYND